MDTSRKSRPQPGVRKQFLETRKPLWKFQRPRRETGHGRRKIEEEGGHTPVSRAFAASQAWWGSGVTVLKAAVLCQAVHGLLNQ